MANPKLHYTLEQPHGLGELYFKWQRGESKSLLVTTGTDGTLAVHDRHGKLKERIRIQGLCVGMEWDCDGDLLAVITPSTFTVLLWECHINKKTNIETGLREPPSCIAWAYGEPMLAVGTAKGNVAIYNHHITKSTSIIGKHSKKITCAAWNKDNILALVSDDRTLSINNSDGDTLRIITLRDIPSGLQFSEMKTDERIMGDNTVSIIVGKKTLYLNSLIDPENPIELAFQQKYGNIVSYNWYGDGYILIGFTSGYLISISTHIKEVGQELFQVKAHKDVLSDIALNTSIGHAASCGDNQFKLHSIWNNSECLTTVSPPGGAELCGWSNDNQLLAIAGRSYINVYITSMPPLYSAFNTRIIALTSLSEATIYQCIAIGEAGEPINKEPYAISSYNLPSEPSLISLGSNYMSCIQYNHVWFFQLLSPNSIPIQKIYSAAVSKLVISNEYAAGIFDGKVMLHMIEQPPPSKIDEESKIFPETSMKDSKILDIAITNDFLIFATDTGYIEYFALEEWNTSVHYKHSYPINTIYSDISGTRLLFIDNRHNAFVFNPSTEEIVQINQFPEDCKGVIWDICLTDRNVFVAFTADTISTYYFTPRSVSGSYVDYVSSTNILNGITPLILFAGDVYCYSKDGSSVTKVALTSHNTANLADPDVVNRLVKQIEHLNKMLVLRRYNEAWAFCEAINDPKYWIKLGVVAIENLDVEFAIRVYKHLGDVAMVWSLEDASEAQDIAELCGRLCACTGGTEGAVRARCWAGDGLWSEILSASILDWEHKQQYVGDLRTMAALKLQRANYLHYTGDFHEAIEYYEDAIIRDNFSNEWVRAHNEACVGGAARAAVRCGDVTRALASLQGPQSARNSAPRVAQLLSRAGHHQAAAELYERADLLDNAAALYAKIGAWNRIETFINKVSATDVLNEFARVKENDGRYTEALSAYIRARDFDSAVRLNLEKLKDPDEAVKLVLETRSLKAARLVADYFVRCNDTPSALRFLVMALQFDDAFNLADSRGELRLYGELLLEVDARPRTEDFLPLAKHFDQQGDHMLAGKYFYHSKNYQKALTHLFRACDGGDKENEALTIAIDTVVSAGDENMYKKLIQFLLGELDGLPHDPKFLFRLYMARKQYNEAAKTAIIIAGEEQAAGNYRAAHQLLCSMIRTDGGHTRELREALSGLHTYLTARRVAKLRIHSRAARLLTRLVAQHIHAFPLHVVAILTSTVIECIKAGLKNSAYRHARMLMKPEYRSQIDQKFAKKIESVIRHPPKEDTEQKEDCTPCPICNHEIPETQLTCHYCQAALPFCIASGCHILKNDLTACPECDFPAIRSELLVIIKDEGKCPMCFEIVEGRQLVQIDDYKKYIMN